MLGRQFSAHDMDEDMAMIMAMTSDDLETISPRDGKSEGRGPSSDGNNENNAADSLGMAAACFDFNIPHGASTAIMTAEPGVGSAGDHPAASGTADQFDGMAGMGFGCGLVAGSLDDDMNVLMRSEDRAWPNNLAFSGSDSMSTTSGVFTQSPASRRSHSNLIIGQMNITSTLGDTL